MPTVSIPRNQLRPRFPAAAVAVVAVALVVVLALATWSVGRQSTTAANAATALAQLREQQVEIESLGRQLAALRGTTDLMQAEVARLNDQHRPEDAAPSRPLAFEDGPEAVPAPIVSKVMAPIGAPAAAPHRAAVTHPRRGSKKLRTVVVDGITYVQGREPHALSVTPQ